MLPVPKVLVPNGALFERSREFDVGHRRPGILLRYRIIHLWSIWWYVHRLAALSRLTQTR